MAILPEGSKIASVSHVTKSGVDAIGQGVEIVDAATTSGTPPAIGHSEASKGTPLREDCRTIWFDVSGTGTDDQVYDCYQKFKLSSTSYIYNRYSKATVAQVSGVRRELHEYTIRFREAKGYARITGGPYNYGPLPGSSNCSTGKFAYAGVEIPLRSCDSIANLAGGASHQTGTRYTGHENKQRYVDSYARYTSNGNEPVFSDYVWLTVGSCGNLGINCYNTNNDYNDLWTDGLWS